MTNSFNVEALHETPIADDEKWDDFLRDSICPSFLHSRRFLNHHEDRFRDQSLVVYRDEEIVGLLPAAEDPTDERRVVSHPGATYGGVVTNGSIGPDAMLGVVQAISGYFAGQGYEELMYRSVPFFYYLRPYSLDVFALKTCGAQLVFQDLAATIDLTNRGHVRERRRRDIRSRLRRGLEIEHGAHLSASCWSVVVDNRHERFGVDPVHSQDEIELITRLFPEQVLWSAAVWESEVVATTIVFRMGTTDHLQYMANSELGRQTHALDALVEDAIQQAVGAGKRYFDFGKSSKDGRDLNASLHAYKESFGAGTTTYDQYELPLT